MSFQDREKVTIPLSSLDSQGLVTIYDLIDGGTKRCSPIDAREIIASGCGSLTKPDSAPITDDGDDDAAQSEVEGLTTAKVTRPKAKRGSGAATRQ